MNKERERESGSARAQWAQWRRRRHGGKEQMVKVRAESDEREGVRQETS